MELGISEFSGTTKKGEVDCIWIWLYLLAYSLRKGFFIIFDCELSLGITLLCSQEFCSGIVNPGFQYIILYHLPIAQSLGRH